MLKSCVACRNCERFISFDIKLEGRKAKCPACGTTIELTRHRVNQSFVETHGAEPGEAIFLVSGEKPKRREQPSHSDQKTLGRYQLLRCIGRGGFGEVWEAKDEHLGRRLAIKLPIFSSRDTKKVQRFLTEGRAAAQLRHPNIVSVFDAGESGGKHFLATEFVSGQALSKYAAERKLSAAASASMVSKLARALHYAHSNNIIHRDIKPHNIVVNEQGEPQILDFGLAKQLNADAGLTIDGAVMGTPAYMAPEQARGDLAAVGPLSDQYSLGATLYWMLTGKPMFDGPPAAVIAQVAHSAPKHPSQWVDQLDLGLEAICLKATSKLPGDRYGSCHEFVRDLERFLNDEVVTARPISSWGHAIRWTRRNPLDARLIAAAVCILCVGLAISVAGWWRSRSLARIATDAEQATVVAFRAAERTEAEMQAELQRLASAKSRAEEARTLQAKAQAKAEETQEQLRGLIAQNLQLESQATTRLELVRQNLAKTTQLAQLITQSNLALGAQVAEKEAWSAENASRAFQHAVYHQAGEAIRSSKWDEARRQLDHIFSKDRGWLWATLDHLTQTGSTTLNQHAIGLAIGNHHSEVVKAVDVNAEEGWLRLQRITKVTRTSSERILTDFWLDLRSGDQLAILSDKHRFLSGEEQSQHHFCKTGKTLGRISWEISYVGRSKRQSSWNHHALVSGTLDGTHFSHRLDFFEPKSKPKVCLHSSSDGQLFILAASDLDFEIYSLSATEKSLVWSFRREPQVLSGVSNVGTEARWGWYTIAESPNHLFLSRGGVGLSSRDTAHTGVVLRFEDRAVRCQGVWPKVYGVFAFATNDQRDKSIQFSGKSFIEYQAAVEESVAIETGLFADAGRVDLRCRELDNGAVLEAVWNGTSPPIFLSHLEVSRIAPDQSHGNVVVRKITADPTLKFVAIADQESLLIVEFPRSVRDLSGPVAPGVLR